MSYDVTLKRGDTRNCIKAILKTAAGAPVNLTGCNVTFRMGALCGATTISRAVHIESAAGEVWVVWLSGETDRAGVYRAEFYVTYPDGRKETFPNTGYISLNIMDDIRGED